ncbi:MAG TPA: G/U mismatch-specific DNA glycosylase [Gemmatimonadales bacterium]|nr:G/U mismatch-specific DNA glycosylase [Gemmatimonadales bacterium]
MAGAESPARPTRAQLLAAAGRTVPDLIGPGLSVLFCGINPGLYSAATRHHFARPGNRFWPALYAAGFSDRLLQPWEEDRLLPRGVGITNLVARATAGADELTREELLVGRRRLEGLVQRNGPRWLAVLGLGAYRTAFGRPLATVGAQSELVVGARLWVLPNPSGLNAHYQLPDLVREFAALHAAVNRRERAPRARPR